MAPDRKHFPGPLFVGAWPVEIEWPHRSALADACQNADISYDDLLAAASTGRFKTVYERCRIGSIGDYIAQRFGTKGIPVSVTTACASGATAIQLGVEAIRRVEAKTATTIIIRSAATTHRPSSQPAAMSGLLKAATSSPSSFRIFFGSCPRFPR